MDDSGNISQQFPCFDFATLPTGYEVIAFRGGVMRPAQGHLICTRRYLTHPAHGVVAEACGEMTMDIRSRRSSRRG